MTQIEDIQTELRAECSEEQPQPKRDPGTGIARSYTEEEADEQKSHRVRIQ